MDHNPQACKIDDLSCTVYYYTVLCIPIKGRSMCNKLQETFCFVSLTVLFIDREAREKMHLVASVRLSVISGHVRIIARMWSIGF